MGCYTALLSTPYNSDKAWIMVYSDRGGMVCPMPVCPSITLLGPVRSQGFMSTDIRSFMLNIWVFGNIWPGFRIKLEMKVREYFTIMEKTPNFLTVG